MYGGTLGRVEGCGRQSCDDFLPQGMLRGLRPASRESGDGSQEHDDDGEITTMGTEGHKGRTGRCARNGKVER